MCLAQKCEILHKHATVVPTYFTIFTKTQNKGFYLKLIESPIFNFPRSYELQDSEGTLKIYIPTFIYFLLLFVNKETLINTFLRIPPASVDLILLNVYQMSVLKNDNLMLSGCKCSN